MSLESHPLFMGFDSFRESPPRKTELGTLDSRNGPSPLYPIPGRRTSVSETGVDLQEFRGEDSVLSDRSTKPRCSV